MDSDVKEIGAGILTFTVEHRTYNGGSEGARIKVFGTVDDRNVELIRFDCGHSAPHYHYYYGSKNESHNLDASAAENPIGWTMVQLRENIQDMVLTCGYPGVANQINREGMEGPLRELERMARAIQGK